MKVSRRKRKYESVQKSKMNGADLYRLTLLFDHVINLLYYYTVGEWFQLVLLYELFKIMKLIMKNRSCYCQPTGLTINTLEDKKNTYSCELFISFNTHSHTHYCQPSGLILDFSKYIYRVAWQNHFFF